METNRNSSPLEAEIFNALAHPARLDILGLLREGERCVCHIQAMLDQRQAYISQHLNVLRQAGLVARRKEGLRVYYQVADPRVFELIEAVQLILRGQKRWRPPKGKRAGEPRKACTCPQCTAGA